MPLTASFGKANFILKTNDYDVIATAILATVSGEEILLQRSFADHYGWTQPQKKKTRPDEIC